MATVQSITARARLEIGDYASPFSSQVVGDGITGQLELSRNIVDPTTVSVTVSGVPKTQGVDYTVDTAAGVLDFVVPPPIDALVLAIGSSCTYFTDNDYGTFINTASAQHLYGRNDAMNYPLTLISMAPVEDYLLSILVVIEALQVLSTSAAFDIDISTPEGVHIPRSERFQQLQQIIAQRQAQYNQLAQALNVGLYRIEMFDLRRVSRMTGKLVPLYKEQEVEDNRPPIRLFVPIDNMGPIPNAAVVEPPRLDLTAIANQAFSITLNLGVNLTGLTVKAHIRPYPGNLSSLAQFITVVNSAATGQVTITLTGQQTWHIPSNCFWDIQSVDLVSNVNTLTFGTFYTDRQGQP